MYNLEHNMDCVVGVQLLKMPSGWSFTQGAAFLVQSLTAYYGLKSLGNLQVSLTSTNSTILATVWLIDVKLHDIAVADFSFGVASVWQM